MLKISSSDSLMVWYCTDVEMCCSLHKPSIERVQALANILHSALCCHSNETRAPIANPPSSAQLEGIPYHSPSYIRVCAVVWERGEGQTDTQMYVTNIHFASAMQSNHFNSLLYTTSPQPFYGPFSGTTQVSRCQKRTSALYGARGD